MGHGRHGAAPGSTAAADKATSKPPSGNRNKGKSSSVKSQNASKSLSAAAKHTSSRRLDKRAQHAGEKRSYKETLSSDDEQDDSSTDVTHQTSKPSPTGPINLKELDRRTKLKGESRKKKNSTSSASTTIAPDKVVAPPLKDVAPTTRIVSKGQTRTPPEDKEEDSLFVQSDEEHSLEELLQAEFDKDSAQDAQKSGDQAGTPSDTDTKTSLAGRKSTAPVSFSIDRSRLGGCKFTVRSNDGVYIIDARRLDDEAFEELLSRGVSGKEANKMRKDFYKTLTNSCPRQQVKACKRKLSELGDITDRIVEYTRALYHHQKIDMKPVSSNSNGEEGEPADDFDSLDPKAKDEIYEKDLEQRIARYGEDMPPWYCVYQTYAGDHKVYYCPEPNMPVMPTKRSADPTYKYEVPSTSQATTTKTKTNNASGYRGVLNALSGPVSSTGGTPKTEAEGMKLEDIVRHDFNNYTKWKHLGGRRDQAHINARKRKAEEARKLKEQSS